MGFHTNDMALAFDSTSDAASTVEPVVDTSKSFSVTAFVNPSDATSKTQVAVSQDGELYSGFKLGRMSSGNCENAMMTCFGFWRGNADVAGSTNSKVVSTLPVTPGGWTLLAGTYDATTKQMSLYVCDLSASVVPEPKLAGAGPYAGTPWRAIGKAQLGRGLVNGAYGENWVGGIDDARLYNVSIPIESVRTICQGDLT